MKLRADTWPLLLCLAATAAAGCHRNIVSALPQSVSLPPQVQPMPQPAPAPEAAQPDPAPLPEPPPPAPDPLPATPATAPAPPRPRPAPVPEPQPAPEPPPAPPQISPALTPQQEANAKNATTRDVQTAEKNLQSSNGKRLNASQKDLVEKVRGFLNQTHDAIRTNDWVRAQNLASKAQILSAELIKSLH